MFVGSVSLMESRRNIWTVGDSINADLAAALRFEENSDFSFFLRN